MATSKEYIDFVLEQLEGINAISCKKMFGEYLVYISGKPAILVCDNAAMVKKLPELAELLKDARMRTPMRARRCIRFLISRTTR